MNQFRIDLREDTPSYAEANLFDKNIPHSLGKNGRPALIVIPGGCYLYKSSREGDPVAARFSGLGYQTFNFQYLSYWKKKYEDFSEEIEVVPQAHFPEQVIDLYKLIKIIRENAEEWGIDPEKVYVLGFSAGGHIAAAGALLAENEELLKAAGASSAEEVQPDAAVLGYPMLDAELIRERTVVPEAFKLQAPYLIPAVFGTEHPREEQYAAFRLKNHVKKDAPPMFVWHTAEDRVTSPVETLSFVQELIKNGVPAELHLFEHGGHGSALADAETARGDAEIIKDNASWAEMADHFLKRIHAQKSV